MDIRRRVPLPWKNRERKPSPLGKHSSNSVSEESSPRGPKSSQDDLKSNSEEHLHGSYPQTPKKVPSLYLKKLETKNTTSTSEPDGRNILALGLSPRGNVNPGDRGKGDKLPRISPKRPRTQTATAKPEHIQGSFTYDKDPKHKSHGNNNNNSPSYSRSKTTIAGFVPNHDLERAKQLWDRANEYLFSKDSKQFKLYTFLSVTSDDKLMPSKGSGGPSKIIQVNCEEYIQHYEYTRTIHLIKSAAQLNFDPSVWVVECMSDPTITSKSKRASLSKNNDDNENIDWEKLIELLRSKSSNISSTIKEHANVLLATLLQNDIPFKYKLLNHGKSSNVPLVKVSSKHSHHQNGTKKKSDKKKMKSSSKRKNNHLSREISLGNFKSKRETFRKEARQLFEKVLQTKNNPVALFELAGYAHLGIGGAEKNEKTMISNYRLCISKYGNDKAMAMLGIYYLKKYMNLNRTNKVVEPGYENKFIKLFKLGSKKGNFLCEISLGYCYGEGIGVPKDFSKFITLLERAAKKSNLAKLLLGLVWKEGIDPDWISEKKAIDWLLSCSINNAGNINFKSLAKFHLAQFFDGIHINWTNFLWATKLFRDSAMGGNYEGWWHLKAMIKSSFFDEITTERKYSVPKLGNMCLNARNGAVLMEVMGEHRAGGCGEIFGEEDLDLPAKIAKIIEKGQPQGLKKSVWAKTNEKCPVPGCTKVLSVGGWRVERLFVLKNEWRKKGCEVPELEHKVKMCLEENTREGEWGVIVRFCSVAHSFRLSI